MRKPNYDKFPSTAVSGRAVVGWDTILTLLQDAWAYEPVWAVDLYVGSYEEDILEAFRRTGREVIDVRQLMKPEAEIRRLTERFMTDDVLFGYMSNIRLEEYFQWDKVEALRKQLLEHDNSAESIGLRNLSRRLYLRYGPGSGVSVRNTEDPGTEVTVTVNTAGSGIRFQETSSYTQEGKEGVNV